MLITRAKVGRTQVPLSACLAASPVSDAIVAQGAHGATGTYDMVSGITTGDNVPAASITSTKHTDIR